MIYTAVSSSITESSDFTPISAIDAIMDINEALIEYNETSYLYEGVGDNIKNLARNIGTKVSNAINTLIQKIRQMMMDNAFKSFKKNVKNKDYFKGVTSFAYKEVNLKECTDSVIKEYGNKVKSGQEISDVKAAIKKEHFDKILVDKTVDADAASRIQAYAYALEKNANEHIKNLKNLKDSTLKELKDAKEDATAMSKYATFVIWAANTATNAVFSGTIGYVNKVNKLFTKKDKPKSEEE